MGEKPNLSSKNGIRNIIWSCFRILQLLKSIGMKIWANENAEKVVFSHTVNNNIKFPIYSGNVYWVESLAFYYSIVWYLIVRIGLFWFQIYMYSCQVWCLDITSMGAHPSIGMTMTQAFYDLLACWIPPVTIIQQKIKCIKGIFIFPYSRKPLLQRKHPLIINRVPFVSVRPCVCLFV